MTVDRYTGDPKITLGVDGADMNFRGGQPVMDAGIENAVQLSLFTMLGWFGNAYLRQANQVGSRVEHVAGEAITVTSLVDLENATKQALAWMIDTGIAESIYVTVANPTGRVVQATVQVKPPGRDIQTLTLTRNGQNWVNQAADPAYRK